MAAPELEPLLAELLEPDSGRVRRATARLREAFADPQTPARLSLLLTASPRPQVRQMAAVLLRRRLLGRWSRLDPALRQRLPALLAEALERETEHPVTVALAQLAALVLRRGGLGAWGPLGTWLQAGARDPRPPRQEAALLVLSAAVEAAPEALAPHGPPLAALCRGLLGPTAAPGPTAYSLRALGGLAAMLGDGHTELLRSLLPDVLGGVEKLLDADEALATEALEVLDEFLEADPAAVTPHLRPLLDLCLQVGGAATRGDAVRARALATVAFVAQRCPKALLRGGLLPPLLRGLLGPLCAAPPPGRPDPEDEEDEEEEEEEGGEAEGSGGPSPRHAAAQALDALAQALPPEKLLRPLLPLLEPLLGSPRPPARKGGLLALGALAEGCGEHLRRRYLGPALRVLRGGLGDPEASVRGAAACALRRLADCLQPEVATLAGEMLPTALAALEGPGVREAPAKAWYILESLLECLGRGPGVRERGPGVREGPRHPGKGPGVRERGPGVREGGPGVRERAQASGKRAQESGKGAQVSGKGAQASRRGAQASGEGPRCPGKGPRCPGGAQASGKGPRRPGKGPRSPGRGPGVRERGPGVWERAQVSGTRGPGVQGRGPGVRGGAQASGEGPRHPGKGPGVRGGAQASG
ncbi:importin-4-like [Dromaius novaehollandiae]|uniref:importin-4-like n=1 Tax=Dromaius novaehollandiae TaxID=8790 RepID=UPI00311F657F